MGAVGKLKLEQFHWQLIRSHSLAIGHILAPVLSHPQPAGLEVIGLTALAIDPR